MPDTAVKINPDSYLMPSLEHATVADVMHPGIVSCPVDAKLTEVARLMADHKVHCVVVVGISAQDGERFVWGLIDDGDLVRAGIRLGHDETAGALAREPTISVRTTMPLSAAGELMLKHGVTHTVVNDSETQLPIGVLSTLDIAGVLALAPGVTERASVR